MSNIFYFFFLWCYLCAMESIHGIVLRSVRYSDTSQIVDVFTSSYGYLSLVTKQARNHRTSSSMAFW